MNRMAATIIWNMTYSRSVFFFIYVLPTLTDKVVDNRYNFFFTKLPHRLKLLSN